MTIGSNDARTARTISSRIATLLAAAALALGIAALAGCTPDAATTAPSVQDDTPAIVQSAQTDDDSSDEEGAAAEDAESLQVTVSIDAAEGEGELTETAVELAEGATVLDALLATGTDVDVQDSQYGKYVNAIGGIASGDFGSMSGWLVALNGEDLMVSADQQEVADGDAVAWRYVTTFE